LTADSVPISHIVLEYTADRQALRYGEIVQVIDAARGAGCCASES